MKRFTAHINTYAATYELMCIMLAAVGMVLMVITSGVARFIILAGIVGLILLYCCQYYVALAENRHQFIGNLTLHHLCMLSLLAGMFLSIVRHDLAIYFLMAGWFFIIVLFFSNNPFKSGSRQNMHYGILARLFLLTLLSILFYFSF
ncbi:MAG: hypothetical protein KQI35_18450 [Bacteroidetes bacterium]|nr:hypothetical protein [Bacteroidota bacterium]